MSQFSPQECSIGGVPAFRLPAEERCGGTLMNGEDDICCQGVIHNKFINGVEQQCCQHGTNIYDPETQRCIHNIVSDLVEGLE